MSGVLSRVLSDGSPGQGAHSGATTWSHKVRLLWLWKEPHGEKPRKRTTHSNHLWLRLPEKRRFTGDGKAVTVDAGLYLHSSSVSLTAADIVEGGFVGFTGGKDKHSRVQFLFVPAAARLVLYLSGPLASPPFCRAVFQPRLYGGSTGERRRVCSLFLPRLLLVCTCVEVGVKALARIHSSSISLTCFWSKCVDGCCLSPLAVSIAHPPQSEMAELMLTHRVPTCRWRWWTMSSVFLIFTRDKHAEWRWGCGMCNMAKANESTLVVPNNLQERYFKRVIMLSR